MNLSANLNLIQFPCHKSRRCTPKSLDTSDSPCSNRERVKKGEIEFPRNEYRHFAVWMRKMLICIKNITHSLVRFFLANKSSVHILFAIFNRRMIDEHRIKSHIVFTIQHSTATIFEIPLVANKLTLYFLHWVYFKIWINFTTFFS